MADFDIVDDIELKSILIGDDLGVPRHVSKARLLRSKIEDLSSNLDDATAYEVPELFPKWSDSADYLVGDRVCYEFDLYKCLTAHTAQPTWTPPDSPSLWVRIDDPAQEWPEWVQPKGSTDAYDQGAKVSHNNKHWVSEYNANIWEPGVYGWAEA